jgi:hypothetical protein
VLYGGDRDGVYSKRLALSSVDLNQSTALAAASDVCVNGFNKWVFPLVRPIMTTKLTVDQAGRVLIPKALLKKENGVWVYQGEPSDASITDLIDRGRDGHIREQF